MSGFHRKYNVKVCYEFKLCMIDVWHKNHDYLKQLIYHKFRMIGLNS